MREMRGDENNLRELFFVWANNAFLGSPIWYSAGWDVSHEAQKRNQRYSNADVLVHKQIDRLGGIPDPRTDGFDYLFRDFRFALKFYEFLHRDRNAFSKIKFGKIELIPNIDEKGIYIGLEDRAFSVQEIGRMAEALSEAA